MSNLLNPKKYSKTETTKHLNKMGGASWDISNPITRLRIAASSCFFGEPKYYEDTTGPKKVVTPTYHHDTLSARERQSIRDSLGGVSPASWSSLSPVQAIESAIDEALDFDAEATLIEASRLRREDHIRTTPQVILVRAANHPKVRGTGLVRKYADAILARADEPATGLAYHIAKYGKDKPVPNALKKAWAARLARASEYELAKYRLEGRQVKTVDVVNLTHPKSEAVGKLVKGQLKTTEQTWEAIISAEGSTPEAWTKAINVMGHMGLLRNLRNLTEKKVPTELYLDKLVEGAKNGNQLPFRYYSAYQATKEAGASGPVLDAVEQCMKISIDQLPRFKGRTMSLCDNSGSARGTTTSSMGSMQISTIANLTGIITGQASDDGYIGVFGDRLDVQPVRKSSSVFDQLDGANRRGNGVGQATENGIWLFWDNAINKKEHWDNVFVFSDMQAGHGGLYGTGAMPSWAHFEGKNPRYVDVAKLVNKYRREVNPKVNVFLVQVAGYQDTILPEFYDRTYILGGWGEGLLKFAHAMANPPTQEVSKA